MPEHSLEGTGAVQTPAKLSICLLYTSDAADERSSVDLGGRRIIKKKKKAEKSGGMHIERKTNKNSNGSRSEYDSNHGDELHI